MTLTFKSINIILLLILFSINSYSQLQDPISVVYEKSVYDAFLYFSEHETEYFESNYNRTYLELAATLYSYMGKYDKVEWYIDKRLSKSTKKDSTNLSEFGISQDSLMRLYESTNVLLINEAHHRPIHRAFLISQLAMLKEIGYKYLALESYSSEDSALQKRGYPIHSTGYYTNEPIYSNLVRKAIVLGFELISYDDSRGIRRDVKGAKNICKVYDKNKGKLVVLAGYGHIEQRWPLLGNALMRKLNEDVLSIAQDNTYGKDYVISFEEENSAYVLQIDKSGDYDYFISYDKSGAIKNIPSWYDWVYSEYLPLSDFINYKFSLPTLIQVIPALENNGVPVFQYLIENDENITIAFPKKGLYKIVLTNAQLSDTLQISL